MSRHRVNVPIYALSRSETSVRRMALYRNVRPMLLSFDTTDRDALLNQAEARLIEKNAVASGDSYAITCGEPIGTAGGTNMLKVMRVPR